MEVIAHRGASAYALENSREALDIAWQMRADRVEIDVRVTHDGVPIVIHDPILDRVTTGHGPIVEVTFSQLSGVRLRNGEPILPLGEAITMLKGKCPLYIDLKERKAVEPTIEVLRRARAEGVIIAAAHPETLQSIHRLAPEFPTALLVHATGEEVVDMAQAAGAEFVHLCWERYPDPIAPLTSEFFARAQSAGLKVILWHEERPEVLEKIVRLKDVFGVCTNMPDLARRILTGHGK